MNRRCLRHRGLTLIELLLILALIGSIAAIVLPAMIGALHKAKINKAIGDIATISSHVNRFQRDNERWPTDLGELGPVPRVDPWGFDYVYRSSDAADWNGRRRRDRWMNPLNWDFDVFSIGPDGDSRPPLPPPVSHDDIVRANGGSYIGEAWKF